MFDSTCNVTYPIAITLKISTNLFNLNDCVTNVGFRNAESTIYQNIYHSKFWEELAWKYLSRINCISGMRSNNGRVIDITKPSLGWRNQMPLFQKVIWIYPRQQEITTNNLCSNMIKHCTYAVSQNKKTCNYYFS